MAKKVAGEVKLQLVSRTGNTATARRTKSRTLYD